MDHSIPTPLYGPEGLLGQVTASTSPLDGNPVSIEMADGQTLLVPGDLLRQQPDGSYYLSMSKAQLEQADIVIPLAVEKDVTLRREQVKVERTPVDCEVTGDEHFVEGQFEISQTEEQPMVRKEARVVEEVHVRKDVDENRETVRDTVCRQQVNVSDLSQDDMTTPDTRFQEHYQTTYSYSGRDYTFYQNAYQYGYHLGSDDRYRTMDWRQLEPAARQWWEGETVHRGISSQDVRDAVRHGWEVAGRE